MALTQGARNKIKSFVQAAKKMLMNEFESQLQQYYGIRPDGSCLLVEELTSREASVIETARLLRQRLHYLEEGIAGKDKAPEAVRQLIREQAFTILNRFAAIRMSEERNIIRESVRQGYNSEGFLVYDQLTGGAKTAEQFTRYSWYIGHVFDELAIDLPAVFDRFSPYALLFPSEKVLLELLSIINDENVNIYREVGHQQINLWKEDETIGWIYQYYNSREEISEMREASGAPRNSRELAVRNQFFTPRYVVQFLVDNSLGRQWFEMTQGKTNLVDSCQYLVKQENEIFLQKGEAIPEAKIVGANYVEYRAIKDPREILMLDPACGSMHFGLYCFDLFEQIYVEAWDNHPELLNDLRDKYLRDDFIKRIPKYILLYNIHGVDIDPRAIQIAGLSLWLRAQKSYDKFGLQPADRPAISKSNLVIAEPMPGDAHLLSEFTKSLPGPIGKLVRVIWDKMQIAGETGLLLKIEEELKKEIEIAKQEYEEYKNGSTQASLFGGAEDLKAAEMAVIYGKSQKISGDFFDTAEEEVLKALKGFAENAEAENAFQKLLFAEDTVRGFAFIELCRKKYDVILMNPPFGASSLNSKNYIDTLYPLSKLDLATVFIDRTLNLNSVKGMVGSISTRTIFFLPSYSKWRIKEIVDKKALNLFVDLGYGVLDAMVETSAYILSKSSGQINIPFIRASKTQEKATLLRSESVSFSKKTFIVNPDVFKLIEGSPFCYFIDPNTKKLFEEKQLFKSSRREAKEGLNTTDNWRYIRNNWEVNSELLGVNWRGVLQGDRSSRFFEDFISVVNWKDDGYEIKQKVAQIYGTYSKRVVGVSSYFKPGLSWAFRTAYFQPHIVPEGFIPTTGRFLAIFPNRKETIVTCGLWNTALVDYWLKLGMEADTGNPTFRNRDVNNSPFPEISDNLKEQLFNITIEQHQLILTLFSRSPTGIYFTDNGLFNAKSVKSYFNSLQESIEENRIKHLNLIEDIEKAIFQEFNYSSTEIDNIKSSIYKESAANEGAKFFCSEVEVFGNLIDYLLGSIFGRWDMRMLKYFKHQWLDRELFKERRHSPFLYGLRESTLDLVKLEKHVEIKQIWDLPYPINVLEEVSTVLDINPITVKLKEVIKYFWPETFSTIEEELIAHFKVKHLSEIFDKHNKFFDAHIKDYSRNKRVSPIYWHLGVSSGKFNVWVYYPKLNDNSLFKIVNELVDPKIKEIAKEVEVLEFKGSAKEHNDQKEFLAELEDFKEELLRVAQLPYKPNQDDGVLITAAPLHNLFRHVKWKKDTQDCWKALEKGEYDWAHLAYSIWPERVRKKCVKDLSMAIAHGLEDICEVKPKEQTITKSKELKMDVQIKLI